MSDTNFLAFQYALGLLDNTEKQTIERTDAFEKALGEWQLQLNRLNIHAPLSQKSAEQIWQSINQKIKQDSQLDHSNLIGAKLTSWLNARLASWRYTLGSISGIGLLFGVLLFNQTANAKLGWDINTDLSKQTLLITATTHQHENKNRKCVLWVEKDNKIMKVGVMPQMGQKTLNISVEILAMIENGKMIISSEYSNTLTLTPSIIDYEQEWQIKNL
ncbi:hypothetical protein SPBRAN_1742 [uncultured Candidatus Thioglobus sp.]|nr:hypothetical protein SPBRAN_1742 [uncultured Candidatus Thioglobus sp.]